MKSFTQRFAFKAATAALAAFGLGTAPVRAEFVPNYVGVDSAPQISFGIYAGLPNPNFGRLTLLYAHHFEVSIANNHYHPIGTWAYLGPTNAIVVTNSNASGNRIPEVFYGLPPLTLVPAPTNLTAFAGRLVSLRTEEHYSDRRLRPTGDLKQYPTNSSEYLMFVSSGGTRSKSLAGMKPALQLVAKTAGLSIGASTNISLLNNPGDQLPLGEGDSWEAWPLFSTDANAAPGHYSATFKLVDLNATDRASTESGTFTFDFQVPSAPTLAIEDSVRITLPLVTAGYVLQYAPTADGPWTTYTGLQHTAEEAGVGEGAQQTFKRFYTIKRTQQMQFFRMQKQ